MLGCQAEKTRHFKSVKQASKTNQKTMSCICKSMLASMILLLLCSNCDNREKIDQEVAYYPSGALKFKVRLVNGKREGLGIEYYDNGSVFSESFWKDGKRSGTETVYRRNGRTQRVTIFENDKYVRAEDYAPEGYLEEVTLYDSLGQVVDFCFYKENGERDFNRSKKDPVFITQNDTIELGDEYRALVRLGNRQFAYVDFVIGDINDPDVLKHNKPLPKKDSLTAILRITPKSAGLNEISGVVLERTKTWDSIDVIPFTHRFYVRRD